MTVLFRDDFAGDTLDTTKWATGWYGSGITKPVNGAEKAAYDPACVSIKNGKLHLKLEHRKVRASNGTTYPEAAGCVSTLHKFQTPNTGYSVEARLWCPGDGDEFYNWPAFWLDGLGTWPQDGENDVMEGLGGHASWHYHTPQGGPGGGVSLPGNEWHVFRSVVSNKKAAYFYDGKAVGTTPAIEKPQFIILANQSGAYGGKDVAGDMRVDYVEVKSL